MSNHTTTTTTTTIPDDSSDGKKNNSHQRLTSRQWRDHCYTMAQIASHILRIATSRYMVFAGNKTEHTNNSEHFPPNRNRNEQNNNESNDDSDLSDKNNDDNDDDDFPNAHIRYLHRRVLYILTNAFLCHEIAIPLVSNQEFGVMYDQDVRDVLDMVCHWYGLRLDVDYIPQALNNSNGGSGNGNGVGNGNNAYGTSLYGNPNATLGSLFSYRINADHTTTVAASDGDISDDANGGSVAPSAHEKSSASSANVYGESIAAFINQGRIPRTARHDISELERAYLQICVHVIQTWLRGQALQTMINHNNLANMNIKILETKCICSLHYDHAIHLMEALIEDSNFDHEMCQSISKRDVVEEINDESQRVRIKIADNLYDTWLDDMLTPQQLLSKLYIYKLFMAPNTESEMTQRSLAEINRAIELDPFNYYAHQFKARYYYGKMRYSDAATCFRRVIDFAPVNSFCIPEALYLLGLSYLGCCFEGQGINQVLQNHVQIMTHAHEDNSSAQRHQNNTGIGDVLDRNLRMQKICKECYKAGIEIEKQIRGDGFPFFSAECDSKTMIEYFVRQERICAYCNSTRDLKVCTGCHTTYFCSKECQRAQWPKHKSDCKLMAEKRKQQQEQEQKYADNLGDRKIIPQ